MQGWEGVLVLVLLVVVAAAEGALVRRVCWLQWLICCAASWRQCHLRMVSGAALRCNAVLCGGCCVQCSCCMVV
jgi:hypothetical protein